jgi:hypothetical protein
MNLFIKNYNNRNNYINDKLKIYYCKLNITFLNQNKKIIILYDII